jgi:hypothetical protein
MSKYTPDAILDTILDAIAAGTVLTVCSTQPTTYAEATSTYKLADVVIDSGDFSKSNNSPTGRKLTVASQSAVTVDSTGTAAHLAICDGSDLLCVTTVTSRAVTSGDTVTIPAWNISISDPV